MSDLTSLSLPVNVAVCAMVATYAGGLSLLYTLRGEG